MARRTYTSTVRDVSFDLDGEVFTPAAMSLLNLAELAKYADLDMESPAGYAAVSQFFEDVLGGNYQRFKNHCGQHHTDPETLMKILTDVLGDLLGFPTGQPSDSSDGQTITGRTLKVISSDGVLREEPLTPELEARLQAEMQAAG